MKRIGGTHGSGPVSWPRANPIKQVRPILWKSHKTGQTCFMGLGETAVTLGWLLLGIALVTVSEIATMRSTLNSQPTTLNPSEASK